MKYDKSSTVQNINKVICSKSTKRTNYISWDNYFMGIALLAAQRSKDPKTQVGCCIVDKKNNILSIGYNGFPRGCHDDMCSWSDDKTTDNKYRYVIHAEANALLLAKSTVSDGIAYVTHFPCAECAKLLIQAGISKVIYLYYRSDVTSHKLFLYSKIEYKKYIPTDTTITLIV